MLPTYLGVFLLSVASLSFEITLTRVFSVAKWYHWATEKTRVRVVSKAREAIDSRKTPR